MRILIAPDKFKGCLTAMQAAQAMAAGARQAELDAEIDLCPMADGGEGTVDAMVRATGGRFVERQVTGPLPEMKVNAKFGLLGDGETAVIEMAAASGLALLRPEDRNPMNTTTFGTGELIAFAVQLGCRKIVIGIGGSATTDAGLGCLQACGCHIVLHSGEYAPLSEPLCGRDLPDVLMIKSHRGASVDGIDIQVACDVTNPLYGPNGAARVFGPQKGASPGEVAWLDEQLEQFARRIGHHHLAQSPGTGAAGGLGFGLTACLGATLKPGAKLVADCVDLSSRIDAADLVISGEGKLDETTFGGKVVGYLDEQCANARKRLLIICGSAHPDARQLAQGKVIALMDFFDESTSNRDAAHLIARLVKNELIPT